MKMANNQDRLTHIKEWYASQNNVLVELPPVVSYVGKMKKITRFNGYRLGDTVLFRDGKATVTREEIYKLQDMYPNLIVHENTKEGSAE
jgi:signal peptidase I